MLDLSYISRVAEATDQLKSNIHPFQSLERVEITLLKLLGDFLQSIFFDTTPILKSENYA